MKILNSLFILLFYFSLVAFTVANATSLKQNDLQSVSAQASLPNPEIIKSKIKTYYETKGIFANVYEMTKIVEMRLEFLGELQVIVHTKYGYKILSTEDFNKRKPTDEQKAMWDKGTAKNDLQGIDIRTFTLKRPNTNSTQWQITDMGGHTSGVL